MIDRRRLAWGGLGVVLLLGVVAWLAAWLVLPHVAKRQLEQRLGAWLGRTVRVAEVDVRPHALALTAHKLVVAPLPGSGREPQLAAARVTMDFDWSSLWRQAPVLQALEVDKPRLRATRLADGRYDVDDIIARITPRDGQPLPDFALFNVQVNDGEARLDDKPAGRSHRITKLELALPFLSNLPSDLAVTVQPKLAFLLNGAPFDTGITATPFGPKRSADLTMKLEGYTLDPLAAYWPKELGVRPSRGKLDANLALRFEQTEQGAQVVLRGDLATRDVRFVQSGGEPVASWQVLRAQLKDVQPLARRGHLGLLQVAGLDIDLARNAEGQFNLTAPPPARRDGLPSAPLAPPAASAPGQAEAPAASWAWKLDKLVLEKSRVRWRDARTEPAADIVAQVLDLTLDDPQWPMREPVGIKLAADMATPGDKPQPAGRLVVEGTMSIDNALLSVQAEQLQVAPLHPYLTLWLLPRLEGKLSTQATVEWAQGEGARGRLKLQDLKLNDFRMAEGSGSGSRTAAAWKALEIAGTTEVDWLARSAKAGKLVLQQPVLVLQRDAKGRLNAEQWLAPAPKASPAAAKASAAVASAAASAPAPWKLALQEAKLDGGVLRWQDAMASRPVALQLDGLKFTLPALQWPAEAQAKPVPLQWTARMAPVPAKDAPAARGGAIEWRGQWVSQPLWRAEGKLQADQLPLQLLAPYLELPEAAELQRAEGGFKGELSLAQDAKLGWILKFAGDAAVADVNVQARRAAGGSDDLLTWQTMAAPGMVLTVAPGSAPLLELPEASISQWQAKLVVLEGGGLNLLAAMPAPAAAKVAASSPEAAKASASSPAAAKASASSPAAARVATAASSPAPRDKAAAPASRPASAPAALPWQVVVGRTRLEGGRIEFEDRHVKPSVNLGATDLAGSLGRWQRGARDPVTLDLKGRLAGGGAALELAGTVGPAGGQHLAADLRLRGAELDAAALSPYAGKYGGQAVARGRLTADLQYKLQADGKLDAQHKLAVSQLTLGERVESPEAVKLPLAAALGVLKDRNGNFELNLPVAGSLADAQFSLPVAFGRQLQAVLAKAAATPLAALTGGEDLTLAEFEPGSARLAERGRVALDRLARVLMDKPGLQLALSGSADAATERDAAGGAERVRELALQRATAARDHLASRGVPAERLVITALRMRGAGADDASWTPRVYLALSGQ